MELFINADPFPDSCNDGAGRRIRRKVSGQTKTIRKNHDCLQPLLAVIGSRRLRELDADEVHDAPLRPVR
jgi:hypothetical protein